MSTETTPSGDATSATSATTTGGAEAQAAPETKESILAAMNEAAMAAHGAAPAAEADAAGGDDTPPEGALSSEGEGIDNSLGGEETEGDDFGDGAEDAGTGQGEGKPTSKNFRGRWDHLDDTERRVVELTTKQGLTLKEAMARVYDNPFAKAFRPDREPAPPEEPKPDPVALVDEQIAAKQAEVDALEEAMDEGFDRDPKADRKKHRALLLELSELSADKRLTQRQKERDDADATASSHGRWQTGLDQAAQQARDTYPDAEDATTEFGRALQDEMAYLYAASDPILKQPDFPFLIAKRIARQLGIRPAAAKPEAGQGAPTSTPAPSAPTPSSAPKQGQQANKVRPVPTGGSPVAPPSIEDRVAQATTKAEMLELMKELGTPLPTRHRG